MLTLQSRSKFGPRDAKWTEEDGTTRQEPTLRMRRLANQLAREEREVRFVDSRKANP